jgi:hypothetical protein
MAVCVTDQTGYCWGTLVSDEIELLKRACRNEYQRLVIQIVDLQGKAVPQLLNELIDQKYKYERLWTLFGDIQAI